MLKVIFGIGFDFWNSDYDYTGSFVSWVLGVAEYFAVAVIGVIGFIRSLLD
jgi:hypothetical protein